MADAATNALAIRIKVGSGIALRSVAQSLTRLPNYPITRLPDSVHCQHVTSLSHLGWSSFFEDQRVVRDRGDLRIVRVVEQQRGLYALDGEFEGPGEVSGHLRHEALATADLPVVGDWVLAAAITGSDRALIQARLERRSSISRKAAGRTVSEQVIAANVDRLFVVTAFAGDLNPRRVERYLTAVWEGGAVPVVVVNKSDLAKDAASATARLRERLPFVDIVAVCALSDDGLAPLQPYLRAASTVALIGSSGVGKSTILNRLVGNQLQKIAPVSDADGRGRHTTTARHLIVLPGGGLLIDTPGMRELQPWADTQAVDAAFEDIAEIAAACRFGDCTHTTEPGCAVLAGAADGTISADRLENYRKLLRELAFEERKHDKAASANVKRRWKQIQKEQRALSKRRDGSG
jgi:ribosome biogenesis GTPase